MEGERGEQVGDELRDSSTKRNEKLCHFTESPSNANQVIADLLTAHINYSHKQH